MHADTKKYSLICRLSAEMTAFTSSTDSIAYCQQQCSNSTATSPFFLSSCCSLSPHGSFFFFYLEGIAENIYFPMCLRQVLPPLISNPCQPQSRQMWAYWRSALTTRGRRSPDGRERREEVRREGNERSESRWSITRRGASRKCFTWCWASSRFPLAHRESPRRWRIFASSSRRASCSASRRPVRRQGEGSRWEGEEGKNYSEQTDS